MRLIDAEPIERELFKQADKSLAKNPYENARICAFRQALELILNAPTITSLPNEPLTLEELREMDGEPVWCVSNEHDIAQIDCWTIVSVELERCAGNDVCLNFEDYGGWLAYRRKPGGGQ